jgi:hypothetical protein
MKAWAHGVVLLVLAALALATHGQRTGCGADTVATRADAVQGACCKPSSACDATGWPRTCTKQCASKFVPFFEDCHALVRRLLLARAAHCCYQPPPITAHL